MTRKHAELDTKKRDFDTTFYRKEMFTLFIRRILQPLDMLTIEKGDHTKSVNFSTKCIQS